MSTEGAVENLNWVSALDGLGTSKTCSEIGSDLNLLWDPSQGQKTDDAFQLDYERQACLLTVSATIVQSHEGRDVDSRARFSGLVGYSDGSQWPDPDGFSEEMFQYLRRRGEETPNPVLKARYLDLVSDRHPSADRHQLALSAIDAYLASAEGFSSSQHASHQMEMIAAMDQAAFLALKFGSVERLALVVKTLLELIMQQVAPDQPSAFGSRPRGRWALELSYIILHIRGSRKYGSSVTDAHLEQTKIVAADLAEQNSGSGHLRRRFLEVASQAARSLKQGREEYSLELQRGEALVQQGEASEQQAGNGPRHLIAATFYESAVQHYQQMRERLALTAEQREDLRRRENALKLKIHEMYRQGRNEFGRLAVTEELSPQEQVELEELLRHLTAPETLTECLQRIVTEGALLPNLKSAEEAALEIQKQSPLLAMFPKRILRDDLTVSVADTKPQRLSQQTRDNLLFWVQINSTMILTTLFARLQEHKGLNARTLSEYLAATDLFEEKNLSLIETGLERYFEGDYVSALHILVPQYEDVLRSLFERSGHGVIRPRRNASGWEYETFGAFLDREEVKQILSGELLFYVGLVMTEPTGWNLRNRIAHGLVHPQDCNIVTAVTVIHLHLLLTLLHFEEKG